MGDEQATTRHRSGSSSYLVRVWQESGPDGRVRFYLRDLKTGEERYVGDPRRIGDLLTNGLKTDTAGTVQTRHSA